LGRADAMVNSVNSESDENVELNSACTFLVTDADAGIGFFGICSLESAFGELRLSCDWMILLLCW
jgi:hypothetical protein